MSHLLRSAAPKFTLSSQRLSISRFYSTTHQRRTSGSSIFDDKSPVDLSEDSNAVNRVRNPSTVPYHRQKPQKSPTPDAFKIHKKSLQEKFPDGWNPPRKLSREAMEGLRQLYHFDKEKFSTPVLAEKFKISPEAVRRILKSRWEQPKERKAKEAEKDRQHMLLTRLRSRIQERKEVEDIFAGQAGPNPGLERKG
ncbi:hypothetical protein D9757_004171 [Collybiopsis confluens]|uniref:Required for respiratory growth protein 9, mitochondrial n=1 Tax=Collybiopsis confluens TaxID=2823264 RepID=A0A8H5MDG2_9AGAR|nr:hypothetical protein D9757_004171 [Collybiopsis confluens]